MKELTGDEIATIDGTFRMGAKYAFTLSTYE